MSKKNFLIITVFSGLLLAGCKKEFLDINQNPNQATENSITPNLTLAAQLNSTAARNASSWDFLHRWLGYWSASGSYSRETVGMSYNITNDYAAGIWNGIYYENNQYLAMEKKAETLGWEFYQGIAKVMRSMNYQVLVDIYGNVPYFKSLDLVGNIRPTYDNGEDIYKDVMLQLDAGLALIKNADANLNTGIATQDILFKGNKTMWAKFVNTLKLRMLLHTYKTTTFNAAAEIAKIQAEGSGFLGSGESASVNPGYTTDKPNPYWAAHMFNVAGAESDNYNRANNFALGLMQSMNDERYKYFYRPAKTNGTFRGTDWGALPIAANSSDLTSPIGYGVGKSATMPMWILTSVESLFLQAEAIARGWLPGDARTAYENAVRESYIWLGVPNAVATADAYLTGPNARVAWPATPTPESILNVIMWQKYFALNGIQANETWTDIRRTDIVQPPLSVAPERGSNPIPVRLLYPSTEYNYNSEEVNKMGTINQFTTKIFWD